MVNSQKNHLLILFRESRKRKFQCARSYYNGRVVCNVKGSVCQRDVNIDLCAVANALDSYGVITIPYNFYSITVAKRSNVSRYSTDFKTASRLECDVNTIFDLLRQRKRNG